MTDRVPKVLRMGIGNTVPEVVIKTIPKAEKNARRQSGCLRMFYKYLRKEEKQKAREKEKDILI